MSYSGPLMDGGPWPVTQAFGCTDYTGEWYNCRGCTWFHAGIDFGAGGASPAVHALGAGTVIGVGGPRCYSCPTGYCGGPNAIGVRSGSYDYWFFHLADHVVSLGQSVNAGQILGHVGTLGCSTGNHLHYQVQPAGIAPDCQHALDPGPFLSAWPGAGPPPPPPPPLCPSGYTWDGTACQPEVGPPPPPPPPPQPVSAGGGAGWFVILAGTATLTAFALHQNPLLRQSIERYVHHGAHPANARREALRAAPPPAPHEPFLTHSRRPGGFR